MSNRNLENEAINTLRSIAELIGNVDHSKGNGGNAAKMRGDLLNDIRTMALAVLEPAASSLIGMTYFPVESLRKSESIKSPAKKKTNL
jgi:hypothetical protein